MAHKKPRKLWWQLPGEERKESKLFIVPVVVDQAAVGDCLPLGLGQSAGGDGELGHGAVGLDFLRQALAGLTVPLHLPHFLAAGAPAPVGM